MSLLKLAFVKFLFIIFLNNDVNSQENLNIYHSKNFHFLKKFPLEVKYKRNKNKYQISFDKNPILRISNKYYLIFEVDTNQIINKSFYVYYKNLNRNYTYNSPIEIKNSNKIDLKNIFIKDQSVRLSQVNQIYNINFLKDRFLNLKKSKSFYEIINLKTPEKENIYVYKFFFDNFKFSKNQNINSIKFSPKFYSNKLLIKYKTKFSSNSLLFYPHNGKDYDLNFFDKIKNYPVKIESIYFFTYKEIYNNDPYDLFGNVEFVKTLEQPVTILHSDEETTLFSIPIKDKINDQQELEFSRNLEILNFYLATNDTIRLLSPETKISYKTDSLLMNLLYRYYFDQSEKIKIEKNISFAQDFKFIKGRNYFLRLNYDSVYDSRAIYSLDLKDKFGKKSIFENIKPNSFLNIKFNNDFYLNEINLSWNLLNEFFFNSIEIFETSNIEKPKVFDFPLLINYKNYNLNKIYISDDFVSKFYRQRNLVYDLDISNSKKTISLDLNNFFIKNKIDVNQFYFFLNNKDNNLKEFFLVNNKCLIKVLIHLESNNIEFCPKNNIFNINLQNYRNIKKIELIINNENNLFKNNLLISGINIINQGIFFDKKKFIDLFTSTFRSKLYQVENKTFVRYYYFLHNITINQTELLNF